MEYTTEMCPNCGSEFETPAKKFAFCKCPNCNYITLTCSMCDCNVENCSKCPAKK